MRYVFQTDGLLTLLTASACYPNDPKVVIMLLVVTFAGVAVLMVAARWVKPAEGTMTHGPA